MTPSMNSNPHVAAERWDFSRLVQNSTSTDPDTAEAVLDQFRMRAASLSPDQRATAESIAERVKAKPITRTVGAAAEDLLRTLRQPQS
jgi:hypothetical protein